MQPPFPPQFGNPGFTDPRSRSGHVFDVGAPMERVVARQPLSDADIRRKAPAVFAERPASTVSDRYTFVPTTRVLERMRSAGWHCVDAQGTNGNGALATHTGRHVLRFSRADAKALTHVGDTRPEVVLYNAHNGMASYEMLAGVFRAVCSNGLVVMSADFGSVKFRHTAPADEIVDASFTVLEHAERIQGRIADMGARMLTTGETLDFAAAAAKVRWADKPMATPSQLLRPRRSEDYGDDLWRVFNRVQENVLRGGQEGRTAGGRRRRVRSITSVAEDARINKALWHLAEGLLTARGANAVAECTALALRAVDFDDLQN